jgi:hypothetical protein
VYLDGIAAAVRYAAKLTIPMIAVAVVSAGTMPTLN